MSISTEDEEELLDLLQRQRGSFIFQILSLLLLFMGIVYYTSLNTTRTRTLLVLEIFQSSILRSLCGWLFQCPDNDQTDAYCQDIYFPPSASLSLSLCLSQFYASFHHSLSLQLFSASSLTPHLTNSHFSSPANSANCPLPFFCPFLPSCSVLFTSHFHCYPSPNPTIHRPTWVSIFSKCCPLWLSCCESWKLVLCQGPIKSATYERNTVNIHFKSKEHQRVLCCCGDIESVSR